MNRHLSVYLSMLGCVLVPGCVAGEVVDEATDALANCVVIGEQYECNESLGCLTHPTTCRETGDAAPAHNMLFQTGTITYEQVDASGWGLVKFKEPFTSTPIVIMSPLSYNGASPAVVRIKNVTESSFKFRIDEWDYLDGFHTEETFSFIATLPGVKTWGGLTVQAGAVTDVTHVAKTASFPEPFNAAPIVLTQVGTYREASAVTPRLSQITSASFNVRVEEEEANLASGHEGEVVHYLAISSGSGAVTPDVRLIAGRTGATVTDAWSAIGFYGSSFTAAPHFFASLQTSNDETAALRYRKLLNGSVEIKAEEEQSLDAETTHLPEAAGFLVLGY